MMSHVLNHILLIFLSLFNTLEDIIEQSKPSGKVDGMVLQTKSYFPWLKILIMLLIIFISTNGQSPVILQNSRKFIFLKFLDIY